MESKSKCGNSLAGLVPRVLDESKLWLKGDPTEAHEDGSGLDNSGVLASFARCRDFTALSRLSPSSGRFFLGLPRLSARRATPRKAPVHIPRCLCRVKASCRAKLLPHSHGYGLTPVWILAWRLRSCPRTKHLLQWLHLNWRSPRCVCT